jgi:glycosyltransferase involved in cell wall biosynthesis
VISKLVIVTEIIAPYRIPVFNVLAQRPEVELHVIFLSETDPGLRQWPVYKDEIKFRYEVLPAWRGRFGRHNLLINRGLSAALNRINPDVLVCGGYNYPACWSAAYWARRHEIPFLLWTESTAFDLRSGYSLVEFAKRRFLNLCCGFVVPGKSSLNYLRKLGIDEKRIFTAPNAVDTRLFSDLADDARRDVSQVRARRNLPSRYFLYAGRLIKEKGVFDLLEAYAQLQEETRAKIGLVFVGDGADRDELTKRASKIEAGIIHFPGFVHREGLAEIYSLANALVFPTYSDPWGLVVNEAMACGLPIIVTNVAGCAADLVQEGENGFVISPGDVPQLGLALARLVEDPELREQLGHASRERIEANSPQAWADGMTRAVQASCGKI